MTRYAASMMRRVLLVVLGLTSLSAFAQKENKWEEAATADIDGHKLTVYAREKAGDVKEVRGVGVFDAPSWVVKNVIDDVVNYKNFMPYTKESLVLSQHDGYIVTYQRLSTPIVEDRDYTLKIFDESREDVNGKIVWKNRWSEANKLGPKPKDGVTRVGVNEGYWLLEDDASGKRTKATYYVYTNPGGAIPTFVINMANAQAVPELYRAVAKAVKKPEYKKTKPEPRSSEKKPPLPQPSLSAPPTPQVTP